MKLTMSFFDWLIGIRIRHHCTLIYYYSHQRKSFATKEEETTITVLQ
jgi:hypothetical protein